uniref:Hikeshi-like domain-containing protein n=1 Tax=Acrobeloides nanus TaxID=290746 RepID=A0A914CMI7_9BILA
MSQTNIFGVIVAGRLIQTDFIQAGETEFVIEISNADTINHVVVFLTGVQPFPDHLGGSVYIRWPNPATQSSDWHYLGFISNTKPSAIFRIAQLSKANAAQQNTLFTNSAFNFTTAGSIQMGIQVEPLAAIEQKIPAEGTAASQQSQFHEFAEKMVRNFVNFAQSFVVTVPRPENPSTSAEVIPVNVIENWYNNFNRRLRENPNFWKVLG